MILRAGHSTFRYVDGKPEDHHEYRGAKIIFRPNQFGLAAYADAWVNGIRVGAFERKNALAKVCRLIDEVTGSRKQ
jgi:hypothetical protein